MPTHSSPDPLVSIRAVSKRQDIELFRILSAAAIIWYHSEVVGHAVSYAAIVVFLLMSGYLAGTAGVSGARVQRRFGRLMVPWLVWFLFYAAFNLLQHKPVLFQSSNWIARVLVGPAGHLWYLPFIFGFLLLLDVARGHLPARAMAIASATLGLCMLIATPAWRPMSLEMGFPIALYAHATAAVLLGTFLQYFDALPKRWAYALLGAAIVVAVALIPYEGMGLPYVIGLAFGFLLVNRTLASVVRVDLTVLSQATLGIYLIHLMVLDLVGRRAGLHGIMLPVVSIVVSTAIVVGARTAWPRLSRYWS